MEYVHFNFFVGCGFKYLEVGDEFYEKIGHFGGYSVPSIFAPSHALKL